MKDKNSKLYIISAVICNMIIASTICYLIVRAGTLNPTGAPADTMKTLDDIYCKQTGCATSSFGTDSPAAPASTMHTLDEIYTQVPAFPTQRYDIYDDFNCANNNGTLNSACAAGDPEYTGEESSWSSSTDSTPPSNILLSGLVFKDSRTGLYWSATATTTMTNNFTMGCTDAQVNNGTCDPCTWATKGVAITTCCGLDLDCSANGCSSSTDWRLPAYKELLQAYVDGMGNNTSNVDDYYWSTTDVKAAAGSAWEASVTGGMTSDWVKTSASYVMCVRP